MIATVLPTPHQRRHSHSHTAVVAIHQTPPPGTLPRLSQPERPAGVSAVFTARPTSAQLLGSDLHHPLPLHLSPPTVIFRPLYLCSKLPAVCTTGVPAGGRYTLRQEIGQPAYACFFSPLYLKLGKKKKKEGIYQPNNTQSANPFPPIRISFKNILREWCSEKSYSWGPLSAYY
jgi:hypothetical protein